MSGEAERTSVFILGVGLIGGSLALALTASGHYRVVGCDRDAETLRKALAAGALAGEGTEEALAQAELVILAVPPQAAAAFLREQATNLRPEAVVTDVCGVKASVVEQCAPLCRRAGAVFVGGHPMAGKERSGFDASEASLFYNASYILVPGEAPQSATDTLVSLAKSMGFGTIKYCTQQKHDRMIAYTSQIPHVLACAYVMSPRCDEHSGFSAGSYRDVSRVARINAELWADLFLANREELADETEELVRNIERIRAAVAKNDRAELVALLSSAREKKEKFG